MDLIFFDSWQTLLRIVLTSVGVYVSVVIFHKISGKRSTSQLNNFDWVVTVMLGSIGASTIVLENVPLMEGMASIAVLLFLQFCVTKYSAYSPEFRGLILSNPRIVFYQGQFLPDAMLDERVTQQELECAMRSEGIHNYSDVEAIVFESDAKLTVIRVQEGGIQTDKDGNVVDSDTIKTLL